MESDDHLDAALQSDAGERILRYGVETKVLSWNRPTGAQVPGGRLTYQDRQRIAEGLTEGLSYAEIARHLRRPTSTVAREVTRNGGPNGYRAANAHQATGQRARRRKIAPSQPAVFDAGGHDREAVHGFQQRFAEMLIQAGFPRMMARVLVHLLTSDTHGLTAAELAEQLQVSPASVSKAVGHLEKAELVRRERDAQQRRQRYLIDDDVWYRAWTRISESYTLGALTATQGAELLGTDTAAGARLREMSQFLTALSRDMTQAAERWHQASSARRRQHPR